MALLTATRTLVKSSPELWAECSDAASLARHLGAFGEIHITKLEPETAVAWEGEDVRGTVTLEPSGWGTRVVLTAEAADPATEATPAVGVGEPAGDVAVAPEAGLERAPIVESAPAVVGPDPVAMVPAARPGFLHRLFGGWRRAAEPVSDPVPESAGEEFADEEDTDAAPVPAPVASPAGPAAIAPTPEPDSPSAEALVGALDSLGRAHRRPFSHG